MRRRTFNKLLGATAATAVLGRTGLLRAADPFKAGFIYVGPVADYGFSHQHDDGRKQAQDALGDKVKTTFVESVKEGPDSERVIHELASGGNGIIFTTSFGFMNPTIKVAKDFPKVYFEHCTGYKRADNVSTYNIRFYEGRYIQGVIAGKMSKSGVVGYVCSVPIPEVVMGMNSFIRGMRSVNPNGKIKMVWINELVRSGKGERRGQGADRPGCRHHRPAHQFRRPAAGGGRSRRARLRPGLRHDQVRAQGAAHLLHRSLGRLLHPAHPGRDGRNLEEPGHLGRPVHRHAQDGALYQHAR